MFEDLVGNDLIKAQLSKAALSGHAANTMLFSGPSGVGKSLFAKEMGLALMYPENISSEARHNVKMENHPDLHIYRPEGKNSMHSIAGMRGLIDEVYIAPYEAAAKIFIIHGAERMLESSANALLKTLEEPTSDSFLFLLTDKTDELLPTIVSRCFRLNFLPVAEKEIIRVLKSQTDKTAGEIKHLAGLSGGSVGRALELAQTPLHEERKNCVLDLLGHLGRMHYFELTDRLQVLDGLFAKEEVATDEALWQWHKDVESIFLLMQMWQRDALAVSCGLSEELRYFPGLEVLPAGSRPPDFLKLLTLIDEAKLGLERNIKLKHCLENLFLKLSRLISLRALTSPNG